MTALKTRHREWIALWLLLALAVSVFEVWPEVDLWVSRLFGDQGRFAGVGWRWVETIYRVVPVVMGAVVASALLAVAGLWRVPQAWRRRSGILALTAVLGVGLLVHTGLKDSWGRPRPVATEAFGGIHPFQPALHPSAACPRNCSFVSGHAAGAFLLLSVGVLGTRRTRWRWWCVGTSAGAVVGLARIAAGGHYASDIVFGLLVIWAVSLVLRNAWMWWRVMKWSRLHGRSQRTDYPLP